MNHRAINAEKVLVLGDDTRSFLSIVRSLGRQGLEVHASPFNFRAPALKSRYIKRIHWLPYYLGDGSEWLNAIKQLLLKESYKLIIPCDERTLLPLHWHRDEIGKIAGIAIPAANGVEIFFDKHKTRLLADSLGIPIAKGGYLSPDDNLKQLIAETGLPMAIKPTASYTADRLYSRNKIIIAYDETAVQAGLEAARDQPHIYEGFFPGQGVGLSILAHKGNVLQAFEHHRVHELQGASYYRVSASISPPLMDAVQKMMQATQYTGIAMTEFRINHETSEWILLEINARPWGSLPLPIALGIDFPFRWYQLLTHGVEIPMQNYRIGIYGRNLIPDIRYLRAQLQALRRQPLRLTRFMLSTISEYLRIFTKREVHDVFVIDDPAPVWQELRIILRDIFTRMSTHLSVWGRFRDRRLLTKALALQDTAEIAVVCQGNICRSPFAGAFLENALSQSMTSRFQVRSYGNLPREGITSPANALQAAKSYGIDLTRHRSRHFTHEAATRAQLIIVFDEINRRWIDERYPTLRVPILFLGSFGTHDRTIADPDGGTPTQFDQTYRLIAEATTGLAGRICNG
ncbi:hypothetical protein BI364_11600 [Acidihalobacter yilgarnensis]|uniref:protein-tyrosine-phosphatase n=2 Tax=Acidihalobacter yilgarnensis TaxID=2819280 RepID=A0A1D8IPY3_9GAMM|nr:hypothetical protein BI364_11600 [Acidihalobacter yilgarnensis]